MIGADRLSSLAISIIAVEFTGAGQQAVERAWMHFGFKSPALCKISLHQWFFFFFGINVSTLSCTRTPCALLDFSTLCGVTMVHCATFTDTSAPVKKHPGTAKRWPSQDSLLPNTNKSSLNHSANLERPSSQQVKTEFVCLYAELWKWHTVSWSSKCFSCFMKLFSMQVQSPRSGQFQRVKIRLEGSQEDYSFGQMGKKNEQEKLWNFAQRQCFKIPRPCNWFPKPQCILSLTSRQEWFAVRRHSFHIFVWRGAHRKRFGKGKENKQANRRWLEKTSVWHQTGKDCSFPAESVGISVRLPDCVSLCVIFFLHSSPEEMGVFLSIKMRARRSRPHRCSSGNRDHLISQFVQRKVVSKCWIWEYGWYKSLLQQEHNCYLTRANI